VAVAARLFDAQLYFEVHELLEPFWLRAEGDERTALQGIIQVAVGLHHLSNANVSGARALLADGAAKLAGRELAGVRFDGFARAVAGCLAEVARLGADAPAHFDWRTVPPLPSPED
jgi:predicted metal-dependent hydrolase